MNKIFPILVATIVVGIGTYLQGSFTERWGKASSEKLERFTANLAKVPLEFGDWQGVEDDTSNENFQSQFKASGCDGYRSRTYTHKETGETINMFLVSGTARHITIHTPDWCYVGAGYEMGGEPHPYAQDIPGQASAELLTTTFYKETPSRTSHIRIFWTYSDDGNWKGPKLAKVSYSGRPALFKIYLITDVEQYGAAADTNPTTDFVRDMVPILNSVLFDESAVAPSDFSASQGAPSQNATSPNSTSPGAPAPSKPQQSATKPDATPAADTDISLDDLEL